MIVFPDSSLRVSRVGMLCPGAAGPMTLDRVTPASSQNGMATDYHGRWARRCFDDTLGAWRKSCGIPRPSSASRACVAAATLARAILSGGSWDARRLGVITASTTSAAAAALAFERRGLTESWACVDPLLLPSTLLSALATQVAASVGAKAFAISFPLGALGVFHALETAGLALKEGEADAVIVIAADEQTELQRVAHQALNWLPVPAEGAGALLLERGQGPTQLEFVSCGGAVLPALPREWEQAPRRAVVCEFPQPALGSAAVVDAVWEEYTTAASRLVVSLETPDLGCACAGFRFRGSS